MVKVKICGITNAGDLRTAVGAGADAVGFIVNVPESPRNLTLQTARNLASQVPLFVSKALVTKFTSARHLRRLISAMNPDVVQLHGIHDYGLARLKPETAEKPVIGAVNIRGIKDLPRIMEMSSHLDGILLDSHVPGKLGGTGKLHDWSVSRLVRARISPTPLILAGGLTPSNVAEAVRKVRPFAVDVSSGVEKSPGRKDKRKVIQFIKNAKAVEQ